jgi:multidrug efflux pump subunit AcrA (membrane-fusion protein)
MHQKTPSSKAHRRSQDLSGSRWWKRGLLVIAVVTVVTITTTIISGSISPSKSGPKLTHRITRGDLIVSVTEQGTLESSNNTEIKCKVRSWSLVTWVIEDGTIVKEGDELVRLDTKRIEDAISLQTTNTHTARATYERTKTEVAKAEIAIPAYLEGSYRTQLKSLERSLKIAETNLLTARKMLNHAKTMFKRGYVTDLEVEGNAFTVTQAELELKVIQTEIDVLNKYTKKMQMETLNGNLTASKYKLESDKAGLAMDQGRLDRAKEELENCVIKAERSGLVIYPSAAAWKETPDIAEGVNVRKDQTLLLMPDLTKMQVKVGIHESIVDHIKPGQAARVTLPDKTLQGKVSSVAMVARPAGWWNGNVVKYDTIIELPPVDGLKPGMSAEVQVITDRYMDVLRIPVAAVVETTEGDFCWVKTAEGAKRRLLKLGNTDDSFIVVKAGLKEGEEVVLNPLVFVEEAKDGVLKPINEAKTPEPVSLEADHVN